MRRLIHAVVLVGTVVLAGGCQSDIERVAADYTKRLCKCAEPKCVETARNDLEGWLLKVAASPGALEEDDRLAIDRAVQQSANCVRRLTMSGD